MFLSSGEGVVFRGALGPWYRANSEQYHLDEDSRAQFGGDGHQRILRPARQSAARPSCSYTPNLPSLKRNGRGFASGAPPATNIVGVQIADAKDNLKLFRPGKYPILRGSALTSSTTIRRFSWTSGYAPRLDTYLGPETPNPVLIRRQRGNCPFDTILRDVMGLTKINFNSCLHNDRLPVTIRFADAVGEIMLAAPQYGEPRLPFKFYI